MGRVERKLVGRAAFAGLAATIMFTAVPAAAHATTGKSISNSVRNSTSIKHSVQPVAKPSAPGRVDGGQVHPDTVYKVGCWTTFAPPAPRGGAMTQYYANCAPESVTVCPAVDVNGVRTTYYNVAAHLGPYTGLADDSDTAVWYYQATIPNGMYTTVYC